MMDTIDASKDFSSLSSLSPLPISQDRSMLIEDDMQLIATLDSVDQLLRQRYRLRKLLAKGCMDISRARYAMGPSRVSEPLFSLKPCYASTIVHVKTSSEGNEQVEQDSKTLMTFDLSKRSFENKRSNTLETEKDSQVPLGLRQRKLPSHKDMDNKEGDVNLDDDKICKSDNAIAPPEKTKKEDPLYWFGALVSPHLRAAQSSFIEAMQVLVDMATSQSNLRGCLKDNGSATV